METHVWGVLRLVLGSCGQTWEGEEVLVICEKSVVFLKWQNLSHTHKHGCAGQRTQRFCCFRLFSWESLQHFTKLNLKILQQLPTTTAKITETVGCSMRRYSVWILRHWFSSGLLKVWTEVCIWTARQDGSDRAPSLYLVWLAYFSKLTDLWT